ncbi:hypothetical protein Pla100_50050 [Neorhodopirellula pilleata]|jgi:hypothetical protein|uniref:Uncharacterized protein n=1 Tax=Neorhodopirellula pilleata TaxID=2714738 RepID=A0A5C5ZVM6_9BACT|nr:hypothetical protein Pla100_50050 [Neorhodopirellula pilleata]
MNDPILDELHATRERLLAESGGTLATLVARLQREESTSGRVLWTPRRTKDCTEADEQPRPDGASTPSAR